MERFPTSQSPLAVQELFIDKNNFRRALERCGIPHPCTVTIEKESQIEEAPDQALASCFLKPCDSQGFSERYGVKGFWAKSRESCLRRIREIHSAGLAVMLQEYIPGPPSNHYYVEGFVDRTGRVCATAARQRIRMNPTDFGNTTYMTSIPRERIAQAEGSIHRLLKEVGYRGIYSAEFKLDPRDGIYKILEVNARPWWYIEFTERCGINLPRMSYLDALGQDVPAAAGYRTGCSFVHFLPDFALWRRLYKEHEIGFFEWIRQWLGARPAVLAPDDPLPGVAWVAIRVLDRAVGFLSGHAVGQGHHT